MRIFLLFIFLIISPAFADENIKQTSNKQAASSKIFGKYRVHIGIEKLKFSKIDKYSDFYGKTAAFPSLVIDYFPFDWYTALGLTFRMGYYSDSGNPMLKGKDSFEKDDSTNLVFTLIPLQVAISTEITPFKSKYFVLSGWYGWEYSYFQETRYPNTTSSAINLAADTSSTNNSSTYFLNTGWRKAMTIGGALSILLTPPSDVSTIQSLKIMSAQAIYLTPFFEIVKSTTGQTFVFDRTAYGVMFTIESL